jgi:hypothetical protein
MIPLEYLDSIFQMEDGSRDAVKERDDDSEYSENTSCFDLYLFRDKEHAGAVCEEARLSQPGGLVVDIEHACSKCFKAGFNSVEERDCHQKECNNYRWLSSGSILTTEVNRAEDEAPSKEDLPEILDFLVELVTVSRNDRTLLKEYAQVMPGLGQVALRCRFCKSWATPGAFEFPKSCHEMPDALKRLCVGHFDDCQAIPCGERNMYSEFRRHVLSSDEVYANYWHEMKALNLLESRTVFGRQGVFWNQPKKVMKRKVPRNLLRG